MGEKEFSLRNSEDRERAKKYLEYIRWKGAVKCGNCELADSLNIYEAYNGTPYPQCTRCGLRVSVKTNTLLNGMKMKPLVIIYLVQGFIKDKDYIPDKSEATYITFGAFRKIRKLVLPIIKKIKFKKSDSLKVKTDAVLKILLTPLKISKRRKPKRTKLNDNFLQTA